MSRKSLPIVLTEAEIIRLEQWVRAGSTPQQVVLRARIIIAAARGQTDLRITGDLRVQRRTVALLSKSFKLSRDPQFVEKTARARDRLETNSTRLYQPQASHQLRS